ATARTPAQGRQLTEQTSRVRQPIQLPRVRSAQRRRLACGTRSRGRHGGFRSARPSEYTPEPATSQEPGDRPMRVNIDIPFHSDLAQLRQSLPAARLSRPDAEIIVAADGAREDCRSLAQEWGASVISIDGPAGPAVARNRAAAAATGTVLVFIDADVVAAP